MAVEPISSNSTSIRPSTSATLSSLLITSSSAAFFETNQRLKVSSSICFSAKNNVLKP